MKRLSTKLGLVAALFSVIAMFGLNMPSASAVAAGAVTGGGSILPGVPGPTGGTVTNSVSFGGTATGAFVSTGQQDAGQCTIGFSGTGTDTTATGDGSGTATCGGTGVRGTSITLSCHVDYHRVGIVVVTLLSGCTGGSGPSGIGAFLFIPGQTPPATVTTYSLVGVVAVAP